MEQALGPRQQLEAPGRQGCPRLEPVGCWLVVEEEHSMELLGVVQLAIRVELVVELVRPKERLQVA